MKLVVAVLHRVLTCRCLGYMFTVNSGLVNMGPLRTPLMAQVKMSSSYNDAFGYYASNLNDYQRDAWSFR